ncbi:MAG: hypothetical protein ABIO70_04345 [Pseudomonadota bacterium]
MRPEEQRSLLLRQVAALRRRGLPHDQALGQAAACLPVGELRAEVLRAQRTLEAGAAPGGGPGSLEALLAAGAADPLRLDLAAQAIEAEHQVRAAVSATRFYLGLAAAAALGLALLVAGIAAIDLADALNLGWRGPSHHAWVYPVLRWGALPVALIAFVVVGQAPRLAPGRRAALRAQALCAAAAQGVGEPPPGLDPNELHYLTVRRAQADAATAAGELAGELLAQSRQAQALLRFIGPLAGVALLLPALAIAGFMLVGPIFRSVAQDWSW